MPTATPWVALTLTDLKSSMTPTEIDLFGKTDVDGALDDRAQAILDDLVAEVRGYIVAAPSRNQLSEDATLIPGSMKAKALALARWNLLITIPGYQPGDSRKAAWTDANSYFLAVAKGTIRPEPPPDAVTNPTPLETPEHGAEIVTSRVQVTGSAKMAGL